MKKALLVNSQLTSADLGLEKDFLVGVRLEKGDPGEKVWKKNTFRQNQNKLTNITDTSLT